MEEPDIYILESKLPKRCQDYLEWTQWMSIHERCIVARDEIGGTVVSTVFLGKAEGYRKGLPLVFETVVRPEDGADEIMRCVTWDEAETGHGMVVDRLRRQWQGRRS